MNSITDNDLAVKQALEYAKDLNKMVASLKAANKELRYSYLDTIFRLIIAAEYRDSDTGTHIKRISQYSTLIAKEYGLPEIEVQNIRYAAPMHDVGKIGIPDNILNKKGKLTREEFGIMKTHCTIGAKILSNSNSKILQLAESIALTHHEKWNGKGYPQGLSKKEIPIEGRIIALADVFDALTSERPYKEVYSVEMAVEIIKKDRNNHFDPELADLFLKILIK